jgi:hypothetical protein
VPSAVVAAFKGVDAARAAQQPIDHINVLGEAGAALAREIGISHL